MKQLAASGAVLAAAAFSLVVSGAASSPAQADDAKIHCTGANACKGQSECATANSSCKGLNACKGQGWSSVTSKECTAAGGTIGS